MASGNGRMSAAWAWDEALCRVVPPLISPLNATGELDPEAVTALVEHVLVRRPDFRVLQGNEALLAASLLQGGDGLVPGLGNVVPGLSVSLCAAAGRGDSAECARIQDAVAALYQLYAEDHRLPCLKAACAALGIGNGLSAPPLAALGAEGRARVAAIVRRHAAALAR